MSQERAARTASPPERRCEALRCGQTGAGVTGLPRAGLTGLSHLVNTSKVFEVMLSVNTFQSHWRHPSMHQNIELKNTLIQKENFCADIVTKKLQLTK